MLGAMAHLAPSGFPPVSEQQNLIVGAARLIEVAGSLVIAWYVLQACRAALRPRGDIAARLLVADGVLAALGFMLAATLLKTLALRSWHQIGMFTFVLVFRTLLKHVFVSERRQLTGDR